MVIKNPELSSPPNEVQRIETCFRMKKRLYEIAGSTQSRLLAEAGGVDSAPRVLLDTWATLHRWNLTGKKGFRITEDYESLLIENPLPPDLPLATACPARDAMAYQLPDRREWIVIARIPAEMVIVVHGDIEGKQYAFRDPLLTYLTETDSGGLAAGFFNLSDMPTPSKLQLQPGTSLGLTGERRLNPAEVTGEDWRVTLALLAFFDQP
jgi:hypothetical protein